MMEHYIGNGLLMLEDVSFPMDYYAGLLAPMKSVVDSYLANPHHARLQPVRDFLNRFPEWRDAPGGV
jgi:hypothetical protein